MIIYRTAGAWGPGAGANLTAPQVDGNFYDLSQRMQGLELNGIQPIQITSFSAVGNQLFIYMSDGTVQGPLTLPTVKWYFRGSWQPSTVYAPDDVVIGPDNAVYLVMFSHTSSATNFNAGANDGQGHDFYSVLLKVPATSFPIGGARGAVLTKSSANNYDMIWSFPPAPAGGDTGQVLQKISDQDGDAIWAYPELATLFDVSIGGLNEGDLLTWDRNLGMWVNRPRASSVVRFETSWAPVVGDESTFMVLLNGTGETTIIIPHDYTQDFADGTELHIHQDGPGIVRIVGETTIDQGNVDLRWHASFSNQLLGQYATATVKKLGFNQWRLFGLLAGA